MRMGQAVGYFQAVRFHELGIGQDLADRSIRNNPPLIQHHYPLANLKVEFEVMRGDKLGDGQMIEHAHELPPPSGIEVDSGLIQ